MESPVQRPNVHEHVGHFNDYNFEVSSAFDQFDFKLYSGVRDWNFKTDFDYFSQCRSHLQVRRELYLPCLHTYSAQGSSGGVEFGTDSLNKRYAHESAIYFQDEFNVGALWRFNVGVRGSYFVHTGPLNELVYDEVTGLPIDTIYRSAGDAIADYWGLEPRINARYIIDQQSSIKAGIAVTNQFIHLVANSVSTLPTDLWVPSSAVVEPQKGYSIHSVTSAILKKQVGEQHRSVLQRPAEPDRICR